MIHRIDGRLALAGAGAALLASLGIIVLCTMAAPLSPAADWVSRFLPLADIPASRAEAALSGVNPAVDLAEAETVRELRIAPSRADAWLRMAFIHALRNGGKLDEPAQLALLHSYEIDPFDIDMGLWRLSFVFNHWRDAGRPIRRKAIEELSGLWSIGRLRRHLQDMPAHIDQASGRLAAGLQINHLNLHPIHQ